MKRSRQRNTARLGGLLIAPALIALTHGAALAQTSLAPAKLSDDADEIIVTAQRSAERLDKVPISISVLSGVALDRSTAQGITESLNRVPGFTALPTGQGGGTQITVRGVGAVAALFSGSSPVGYYIDSAPFGLVRSSITPDASVYDLERVEVLRGPQGVLYGAAALNGVVRILTNDPKLNEFDFKARVLASATEGGGGNYRGDMTVNIPVIPDKLAVRGVIGYQKQSGWIDNLVRDNVNDGKLSNIRLKVAAKPLENLLVVATVMRSRENDGAPPIGTGSYNFRGTSFPEPIHTDLDLYNLKFEYELSGIKIVSTTSKLKYRNRSDLDLAGPPNSLPLDSDFGSKIFTQEIALSSLATDNWQWSAGAIYRRGTDHTVQDKRLAILPSTLDWYDHTKSYAVFGQVTRFLFNKDVDISLGVRYFHDHVTLNEPLSFTGVPALSTRDDQTFKAWTPRVVLTWRPSGSQIIYASYAQGFRSGFGQNPLVLIGYPQVPPANPDRLTNYEIGTKGRLFGGPLQYEISGYYIKWNNIPSNIQIAYRAPNGQDVKIGGVFNAGSGSGFGVDGSISFEPVKGFELTGTASWNGLERDRDLVSDNTLYGLMGERLSNSPELTLSGSAAYSFLLSTDRKGTIEISGNYTSKLTNGSAAQPPVAKSSDVFFVRSRVGIDLSKQWSISFLVENLTNERGIALPFQSFAPSGIYLRPRTFGGQIEYHFR